ncbi:MULTISPECIES: hypothetical protein [Dietzia]|uniref:hypothetical protein n=1 Tax=Dietzia sp. KRD202 TaxID=2729732 RepID=UPI0019D0A99B|nr:hypothetical protein [Dietzia sp. KRD202]
MNSDDLPRQPRIAVNLWNSGLIDISAGGAADTDRAQLEEFVDRTGADEFITVIHAYDPAVRNRSLELLVGVWF